MQSERRYIDNSKYMTFKKNGRKLENHWLPGLGVGNGWELKR
jgi:hypothetical protein